MGARSPTCGSSRLYEAQIVESPEIIEMLRAVAGLWTVDVATGRGEPPKPQTIDHCYELRRAAREAMAALDEPFFDNLKPLVEKEMSGELDRLHLRRIRDGYGTRFGLAAYGMATSNECSIDLVELFERADLAGDLRARIETMLGAYEAASVPGLRARFEASMRYHQASERYSARTQWGVNAGGADPVASWQNYQKTMLPLATAMRDANDQLASLTRQTFATILEMLPPERHAALNRQYRRQAFPTVYEDPVAVADHLERALRLTRRTSTGRPTGSASRSASKSSSSATT